MYGIEKYTKYDPTPREIELAHDRKTNVFDYFEAQLGRCAPDQWKNYHPVIFPRVLKELTLDTERGHRCKVLIMQYAKLIDDLKATTTMVQGAAKMLDIACDHVCAAALVDAPDAAVLR